MRPIVDPVGTLILALAVGCAQSSSSPKKGEGEPASSPSTVQTALVVDGQFQVASPGPGFVWGRGEDAPEGVYSCTNRDDAAQSFMLAVIDLPESDEERLKLMQHCYDGIVESFVEEGMRVRPEDTPKATLPLASSTQVTFKATDAAGKKVSLEVVALVKRRMYLFQGLSGPPIAQAAATLSELDE